MRKKFWGITFSSVSLFTLFLGVTVATADTWKVPGPSSIFGRLDFVNIGTAEGPDGEAIHQAAGWGPIEPITHGGNWGAIGTESGCDLRQPRECDKLTRVTWAGECFKIKRWGDSHNLCVPPAGTQPEFSFDPPTPYEPDSFALYGRAARVVLDPNALVGHGGKARQLRMRILDGIGYDAFEVFVRNIKKVDDECQTPARLQGDTTVLVYRFDPYAPENLSTKKVPEQWRVHTIDLFAYRNQVNLNSQLNALEVIIQSTAVPWGLFYYENEQGGYGQLAVDWIELLGTPKRVDKR
jgi:hypothetical protein